MNSPLYNQKQIDKYRYIAVDYGWSEVVKADFRSRMNDIGIAVERIYYDISYSQGSGSCFSGKVGDWGKYLLHLGYDNPILATAAQEWRMSWKQSGHYCHENSLSYDDEIWANINPYDEEQDALRFDMWANVMNTFDLFRLTVDIKENLRGHMRALYRELETEYEYLTSDEYVSEWMQHNLIELTELEN